MIPLPSVNHLMAGESFYRPHLLAFLEFYYSQRFARKKVSKLISSHGRRGHDACSTGVDVAS